MEKDSLTEIKQKLGELESTMYAEERKHEIEIGKLHASQVLSAKNLVHYLTLRSEDIKNLQDQLHINGLSSIASSESHVLSQIQAIQKRLGKQYAMDELSHCTYNFSQTKLHETAKELFGERKDPYSPYIMVTFDSSFAENYSMIKNLLQNGMQVARINCAHDDEATWSQMIYQLKRAMRYTGISCKIYMDLAGPKIRAILLNKGKKKGKVKVEEGDVIWLAYDVNGFDKDEIVISPDEPGIISMLKKGDRVYIDDGIVKGEIESITAEKASVRILRVSSEKKRIKNDKGINFPDSVLRIDSLTDFDKSCLPFICEHADLVGYSFIRYPSDLAHLQKTLKELSAKPPYIIAKIETPEAVINLPGLLLQGMQEKIFGVMIARGDLAVEIGFERMGEIQDEILWISEAAHVPVVWATQVLENLNKSGMATRSEITDAAHAAMAECIMINKGENIIKVIETLKDILHRIGGHHIKKRFIFRKLNIAEKFMDR